MPGRTPQTGPGIHVSDQVTFVVIADVVDTRVRVIMTFLAGRPGSFPRRFGC